MVAWKRQTRSEIDAIFVRQRQVDPIGHALHTFCAAGFCFFAGWPTSYVDYSGIPILAVCVGRLWTHHRVMGPLVWDAGARLGLVWAVWLTLSGLWSFGAPIHDLGTLRFASAMIVFWPVLDRRSWLIGALVAGIACGQLSQVGQVIGTHWHVAWLTWPRFPDRNSGWWDPVVGGTVLTAGLGLHLGGLLLGTSVRERVIGAAGSAAAVLSILATGTRGAWMGAGLLIAASLGIAMIRVRPRSRALRLGAIAVAAIGVASAAGWLVAGDSISRRANAGISEVRRALNENRFDTDTGARIAMWKWAWAAYEAHPLGGVGAGGYKAWVDHEQAAPDSEHLGPKDFTAHMHAHSWPLHTLATTGLVGFALMGAWVLVAIWNGLHRADGTAETGYAAGPALALIGLVCAGLFDTVPVNQQTACVLFMLLAMCLKSRPSGGKTGEVGP